MPTHASWLNQVELYFSILQRKVLTPNAFADLTTLAQRLLAYKGLYKRTAHPFAWTSTRADLERRLTKLAPTAAA